ncbi:MAG: hypothetical protein HY233_05945 [Acidobacteriales bacterium]|nr:hypothetical protein [Candidatus Koribacter versatilis]MBI3645486.1 hypothetical protein [Terriglobales bacterium]
MTCADVQKVLPEIMDGSPNGEFQTHLKSCPACAELVSDLELIASEARQLAATDEPAPRVWVKIAAELRSEGIIREPEAASAHPVLVPSAGRRWNAWWLAPVAAALVAAGAYLLNREPARQVASENPPAATSVSKETPAAAAPVVNPKPAEQIAVQKAPKVIDRGEPDDQAPMATVSTEDQQFLNGVGQRSPGMRATYESQLQAVNSYIRDAEAYLKQNPGDEDARQQLMNAYEQKAMLYQMALDHVQ